MAKEKINNKREKLSKIKANCDIYKDKYRELYIDYDIHLLTTIPDVLFLLNILLLIFIEINI